jgi:glycerol-1-phosphatase
VTALIDAYDTALFDLDGVIYLGPNAVPGAVAALAELRRRDKAVMYVTNNAARPVQVVIDQLNRLGFSADINSVLTSAQVATASLKEKLSPGSKILVCGSANLAALLSEAGFRIVVDAAALPDAVIQGYEPDLNWRRLDEAALAIQAGADWYATNADTSRPTDRGLVPGVGGAIAVLVTALGGAPTIFGKPYRPMLIEAIRKTGARQPIFVGDRLDTDINGAVAAGIDSLLVFSGAHGKADLVAAEPNSHPSCIGADVGALLAPKRWAYVFGDRATCGSQIAIATSGRIVIDTAPRTVEEQLDALWAVTQLAWRDGELDAGMALSGLELLP